ncbi:MAG: class I SAM-dependent methyltransferase [Deltaproteobacteria bacterium]
MMNKEGRNFDREAAAWDLNPGRVKVAADIAQTILSQIKLTPDMDVLDFGCGTGLLTLALQPFVRSITGVDSSPGMLGVLQNKISDRHLKNVNVLPLDLEQGGILQGCFHLIVSSMTLHHIKAIEPLFAQFHHALYPSGLVCIADLDPEGGQFHSSPDGVFHHGFEREAMRRTLLEAGFQDIRMMQAAQIEKPVDDHQTRVFTVFLITGRR